MNQTFKSLLLRIAQLSKRDQLWIVHSLSAHQKERFMEKNGAALLLDANRLCRAYQPKIIPENCSSPLPASCYALLSKEPLYLAILLEIGKFEWSERFLRQYKAAEAVRELLRNRGTEGISQKTKMRLFEIWQSEPANNPDNLPFQDYLEQSNG